MDFFSVSSVITQNFTFAGGDGANFSADITVATIGASDWSIVMPGSGMG